MIEDQELNRLSEAVIAAAFEVANHLGAGFLEKVYERALLHELTLRGLSAKAQVPVSVAYKRQPVGDYFADVLVDDRLIVEVKCVDAFVDEHVAQCLNYLKATGLRLALLINFQRSKVAIKRVIRD